MAWMRWHSNYQRPLRTTGREIDQITVVGPRPHRARIVDGTNDGGQRGAGGGSAGSNAPVTGGNKGGEALADERVDGNIEGFERPRCFKAKIDNSRRPTTREVDLASVV
jgi:hypothetical protein